MPSTVRRLMETATKTSPARTAAAPACATKNSPHSPMFLPRLRPAQTRPACPPTWTRTPGRPEEPCTVLGGLLRSSEPVRGRPLVGPGPPCGGAAADYRVATTVALPKRRNSENLPRGSSRKYTFKQCAGLPPKFCKPLLERIGGGQEHTR